MTLRVRRFAARTARDIWQGHLFAWRAIGGFVYDHAAVVTALGAVALRVTR